MSLQRVATPRPLNEVVQGVLDVGGNLTLGFGPVPDGWHWVVSLLNLSGVTSGYPLAGFYRNAVSQAHLIDTTANGSSDIADFNQGLDLFPGETLHIAWAGGLAGGKMTARLYGRVEPL